MHVNSFTEKQLHAKTHKVSFAVVEEKVSKEDGGGGEKTTVMRQCAERID